MAAQHLKILPGVKARDANEAMSLAYSEAGVGKMSAGGASLFVSAVDAARLRGDAEKAINGALRSRYRSEPASTGKRWYVPAPQLRYEARDIPHLAIEVPVYLVAVADVETKKDYFTVTLVGPVGKPEVLVIPMLFLHALLRNDLGRFTILAKSTSHTTWDVPGTRPVRLPNGFVRQLSETLKRQSAADWLDGLGSQGKSVMPSTVGALLGLCFAGKSPSVPAGRQGWSAEQLISIAEGMAYKRREAREMVDRALPYLRSEHTLEEATRIMLQKADQGE